MLRIIERTIARHDLITKGGSVLVAVSGGVDSMVLLRAMKELGYAVQAAHVDHGLRGAESDADRRFVLEHCKAWGIPCHVREVKPKDLAVAGGISVQMAARELRREALTTIADEQGIDLIATAHHADDALETLLLNLLRGTGIRGWGTIPVRNGRFIRPLIEVSREQIMATAGTDKIPFREDRSNQDPKYLRNRVRHELLPLMEALRPGAITTARRSTALLRGMVELASEALRVQLGEGLTRDHPVPLEIIRAHQHPMLALAWVLREHHPHPDLIERLLPCIEQGESGARFPLADGWLVVERDRLILDAGKQVVEPLTISSAMDRGTAPVLFTRCEAGAIDLSEGPSVVWLDARHVSFPLTLRPWKPGDRMRPLGLGGSKLVSDILTDAKIDHSRRGDALVLEAAGRIIWLVGHRVDEEAAATPSSTGVWRVEHIGSP